MQRALIWKASRYTRQGNWSNTAAWRRTISWYRQNAQGSRGNDNQAMSDLWKRPDTEGAPELDWRIPRQSVPGERSGILRVHGLWRASFRPRRDAQDRGPIPCVFRASRRSMPSPETTKRRGCNTPAGCRRIRARSCWRSRRLQPHARSALLAGRISQAPGPTRLIGPRYLTVDRSSPARTCPVRFRYC